MCPADAHPPAHLALAGCCALQSQSKDVKLLRSLYYLGAVYLGKGSAGTPTLYDPAFTGEPALAALEPACTCGRIAWLGLLALGWWVYGRGMLMLKIKHSGLLLCAAGTTCMPSCLTVPPSSMSPRSPHPPPKLPCSPHPAFSRQAKG